MPNSVYTYDPKKVIVTLGVNAAQSAGGVTISGFADGTFIEVTPAGPRYTKHTGADGEVSRVANADHTHKVKMTLQQTSPSNDALSALLASDVLNNGGVVSLSIVDVNGTTNLQWKAAWIETPPNITDAKDLSNRDWTLDTAQVTSEVYGSNLGV
jgi:hypothetical protein